MEYGSPSAPHVLLAVINHASSYSKSFILEQLPRLTEEFVKDGSLRIQLLSLPIRKYAQSNKHASAIICAGMQHQGIAMSAAIAASDVIPATNAALKALGIDMKSYLACLAGKDVKRMMEEQAQALEQADVQLAPTFLLDGERFQGLQTYPDLRGRIERLLETE